MEKVDFWCKSCGLDQQTQKWSYSFTQDERYIKTKCVKCGKKLIRLTGASAKQDPYYRQSRNVRMLLSKHRVDTLQPGQEGFQTHYKKQWDEFKKAEESIYRRQLKERTKKDELLKKYFQGSGYRDLALKVLATEEKVFNA